MDQPFQTNNKKKCPFWSEMGIILGGCIVRFMVTMEEIIPYPGTHWNELLFFRDKNDVWCILESQEE